MNEAELLAGLMDVEYREGERECWWCARTVLDRMGIAGGVTIPASPVAAIVAGLARAVDVRSSIAAQAGDLVLMSMRERVDDAHVERQHVGVCLDPFRVVHMTRSGVSIVGLSALRRLDPELRVLRLVPQPVAGVGGGGEAIERSTTAASVAVFDDILTKRNRRWMNMPIAKGARLPIAAAIDAARRTLGFGKWTDGPGGVLATLNGVIVDESEWFNTYVVAGDEVCLAPRPGTGVDIVLVAIALASAAASALLIARVPHPATGSEAERRAAFGRYSSDAVVGDTIAVYLGTHLRAGGKTIVKVPGEGENGDTKIKILTEYGRGPIAGIGELTADIDEVDGAGLEGIYFNDQPISNFQGVKVSARMGTTGQAVIPGFDDTETLREVGVGGSAIVNTDGVERTGGSASAEAVTYTSLDAVNAFVVRIRFPRGLYSISSGGQTNSRLVKYRFRWRLTAGPGAWSAWRVITVERTDQSEFYSAGRLDGINGGVAAEVDIQVERVSVDASSAADVDDMVFDSVQEIQYAENAYAGKALLAIEITASEQLTSPPRISADIRGYALLRLWDGVSSPESPTFFYGYSDNPADLALELMTNNVWGAGAAYRDENIDFESLFAWREFCAEPVARVLGGGTRPRHACHLAMRDKRRAIDWLRTICRAGRCVPSPTGILWRFIVDRERTVGVETFTDRSIAVDESGMAMIEYTREITTGGIVRANRLVASMEHNELRDGRPDSVDYPTLGEQWLATEPLREESVQIAGVTDPEQLVSELIYMMKRTRGLSRTVTFTTSKQIPVVQPGDRFDLASSLPGWGLASGGVGAGCTTSSVVLDRTITLGASAYVIRVVHEDGTIEDRSILSGAGTYDAGDAISVATFDAAPAEFEEYVVGVVDVHVKPFICTRVALVDARKMMWEISGIEYADGVYDDTPGEVDLPDYSTLRSVVTAPGPLLSLVAEERTANGIRQVVLAWRQSIDDAENTGAFRIYRRMTGTTAWVLDPQATPARRQHVIELADLDRAYQFVVVAVSIGGASLSPYDSRHPIATLVYGLAQPPPPAPGNPTLVNTGGNTYTLQWDDAPGAVGYQVLVGGDTGTGLPNDGAEDCLVLARTTASELAGLELAPGRSVTFWIRSEGPSGRLSEGAAVVTLASPALPAGESIKQTRVFNLSSEGTLENLAWNAGAPGGGRLELVSSTTGGRWTSPEISPGAVTLTELTLRPATANDADDPAINTDPFRIPTVASDQWGVIDDTPVPVVGMLMPPWPDNEQTWVFEVRTHDGSTWSAWEALSACASIRRNFSMYQVRVTMTRRTAPYRPALRGTAAVLTH